MRIIVILGVFAMCGTYAKPIENSPNTENGKSITVNQKIYDFFEQIMIPLLAGGKFENIIENMEKISSALDGLKSSLSNYEYILSTVNSILEAAKNKDNVNRPKIYVDFKRLEKGIELLQGTLVQIYHTE